MKEDSTGTELLCTGLLKVTVPADTLTDANQAKKIQHEPEIAVYAEQFNIENSANVFAQDIEYRVQLMGEAREPHIEIEDAEWANVLDQLITFALLKPTFDIEETSHVQLDQQPQHSVAPVKPETEQEELEDDKLRATLQQQGLEKLNKKVQEAEHVQKELLQKRAAQQAATPSSAAATEPVSPSFDCRKASKPTEVTICTHADLAALDVTNRDLYVKAKSINATTTKEIWTASMRSKYACGTDVDCINAVYEQSIKHYGCIGAGKTPDCDADTVGQ